MTAPDSIDWKLYGPCPTCTAQQGQPCVSQRAAHRDRFGVLLRFACRRAHPGRTRYRRDLVAGESS